MNKPGFLEEHAARAIGVAIGSIQGQKFARKAYEAKADQEKMRQDAELELYRKQHEEISGEV